MSQQTINVGASPNDGTGTPLRTAFQYTNSNFSELYTALGGGSGLPGATTQVIFNDGGTNLAGDAGLVYNKTTDALTIGGNVQAASATITGDLTVDTSTLKVDSTNNRVGIGTASPSYNLQVIGTSNTLVDFAGSGVAGMQKMLQIRSASGNAQGFSIQQNSTTEDILLNSFYGGASLIFGTNNTERMRIDTSGNVGIGVTPSAWVSTYRALEIGKKGHAVFSTTSAGNNILLTQNAYFDGSWKYGYTGAASTYELQSGAHAWNIAASGTAGNAITFTQAMTLDASGNLLVAKTAVNDFSIGFQATPTGAVVATRASSSNSDTTLLVYSTGAAAYRFYVGMGGTVYATNTTISAISDARLKENVQDIDVGLGAILALKPRKFDWKAGKGKDIKGDRGFIAQEFEQVFPQLVDEWKDAAPEGEAPYKSVRQDLIPVLVKAIQELTARVQTLEAK